MRFVIAIVLFVAAFFAIGLGIAQRTVLAGPDTFSTQTTTGSAPITIVEGAALNALPGTQTVTVEGEGDIFLAYGRTGDVLAWVGDLPYNLVTFEQGATEFSTETVGSPAAADPTPGATPTPTPTPTETTGDEVEVEGFTGDVPDPRAADLWVQEFSGTDQLIRRINAPQDISLIIMSDGLSPAPADISVSWPLDNSAPLSGPLIIGGILGFLAGLAAFLWALVHARRRRGPRRKQPRLPKSPQPKRLKRAPQRSAITAGPTVPLPPGAPAGAPDATRRGRRRSVAVAGGILTATLLLTGCTTGAGVLGSGLAPTPTSSSTDIAAENSLKPPAVTKQQLGRIVDKIADTIIAADEAKDPTVAATRLAGPALALRAANYAITKADPALATVPAFPTGEVRVVLPQQNIAWPRSVFAIVQPTDATLAPVAVMLVQDSPRENYKVHYLITLEPGFVLPPVAPAQIGSVALDADNGLGLLQPSQLAQAYGDVLILGEEATNYALFEVDGDTLRVDIGFDAKAARKASIPASAKIEFTNGPNAEAPISFPTNDGGQLVAVSLDDTETITPTEAGAAINSPPAVKALSGSALSTKGITATYGVQLLFYVPALANGSDAKIQLLGFSQGLVSAKELG
ncbi:MAG: hypothetical protein ABIQ01_02065 [Pseudolysinimonas sp.]